MDGDVLSLVGIETGSTVRSGLPVGGLGLCGSLASGLSLASGHLSSLTLTLIKDGPHVQRQSRTWWTSESDQGRSAR